MVILLLGSHPMHGPLPTTIASEMKITIAAIITLASASLTSASRPSLRGFELSEDAIESSVWNIARSFKVDSTQPNFIRADQPIFDLGANEVTVIPRGDHNTHSRAYESSKEGSKEASFHFGLSGGAFGLTAAVHASTNSLNKSKKKYVRNDYNIDSCVAIVQMEPLNAHKYLTPQAKDILLQRSPEEILTKIGPYYASSFTLGATFELRVVTEVSNQQQANEFRGSFSVEYNGSFNLNATLGGSSESKNNSTCTKSTTQVTIAGGDPSIWMSRSKDINTKLAEWQKTLTPKNMSPIQHKLQYIWDLLDNDEMDRKKAAEVKSYILEKWEKEANEIGIKEDKLVPATLNKEEKVKGDIIIKQPSEEAGNYAYRNKTQSACNYVQGYNGSGDGKWGVDQLYCFDGSRCLKWGNNAYVGRMTLPRGIKATTYYDWELNGVLKEYIADKDMEVPEFWNRDNNNRAKGFKFEVLPEYSCGDTLKCTE